MPDSNAISPATLRGLSSSTAPFSVESVQAQGWFRDPYDQHDDRWFSAGQPTSLVRDHGVESQDAPPDSPVPSGLIKTDLPPRVAARRRWRWGDPVDRRCLRRRLTQVTAAVAVIATAVTLVIVKEDLSRPPALTRANFPAVPAYYVALDNAPSQGSPDPVVVGDTFTGERLATVSPPARSTFVGLAGAADDRTFVLGAESFPMSAQSWDVEPRTWYLLRIAPGTDDAARLARLPIPSTPFGLLVAGMALSPDGSKLAVALEPNTTISLGPELLRIYSVATGALLRTWTGPPSNLTWGAYEGRDSNTTLSWLADGHTLAFAYGPGTGAALTAGVRTLDVNRPGNDLIADSRPTAWSAPPGDTSTPMATSDGKTLVCVADGTGGFLEYSTATGKLTRTLYHSGRIGGEVLWASPSGNTLIGYLDAPDSVDGTPGPGGSVGVITQGGFITHGGFTPVSFPLASGLPYPDGVAW